MLEWASRRVIIVLPPQMIEVLRRVETMLLAGIRDAGMQVTVMRELIYNGDDIFIIVAANFFNDFDLCFKNNIILFNVENIDSVFMTEGYMALLRRFITWDYSKLNARVLAQRLGKSVYYLPLFFVSELDRLSFHKRREIDVLFYGSFNPRRQLILDDLRSRGLNVQAVFGVYGDNLDHLIERSKVVINIHFYENGHLEWVRLFDLLSNGCVVASECNSEESVDEDLRGAFVRAPYKELARIVEELVCNPGKRAKLAEQAKQSMRSRDAKVFVSNALRWSSMAQIPTDLVLGSGKSYDPNRLNIDINPSFHPDVICDISARDLFETEFATDRFGSFRFERGFYTSIEASHVLEHIPDLVSAMSNCLALLEIAGVMRVVVPYDLSYGAWQDPTHIRAFNERSWQYYCDWCWYLGWTESRFTLEEVWYSFSDIGQVQAANGVHTAEILRMPRAVDEMRVTLRKVALSDSERSQGDVMRGVGRQLSAL